MSYTYDDLYRLTGEIISNDPATQNIGAISYQYDPVGNRTNRTSGITAISSQTSLSYDPDDRLTNTGYVYDSNGSTTTDPNGTYVYDSLGRMTSATVNGVTSTYVYDGDGNKVSQTVNNTTTTNYLVDSNNPTGYAQVLEENQGSSVNLVYTYGTSRISEDQYNGSVWTLSYYGYDGQGSVRYLTNSTGTVTDTYDYDAFGTLINQTHTGSATPNEVFYDGEQKDANTGFYNLRARWMNPGIGRFQTFDSYEGEKDDPLSLHKYEFTSNNPVNESDPSGNDSTVYWPPDMIADVSEQVKGGILSNEQIANIIYNEIGTSLSTPQEDISVGYNAIAHVIINQDWALIDKLIKDRPAEQPPIPPSLYNENVRERYERMLIAIEFARDEDADNVDPTNGALLFNTNRTSITGEDRTKGLTSPEPFLSAFGPFYNSKKTKMFYVTCFGLAK